RAGHRLAATRLARRPEPPGVMKHPPGGVGFRIMAVTFSGIIASSETSRETDLSNPRERIGRGVGPRDRRCNRGCPGYDRTSPTDRDVAPCPGLQLPCRTRPREPPEPPHATDRRPTP